MTTLINVFADYVDALEAAKLLDLHPETVRRLIRQGKLPATMLFHKWLLKKTDVEAYQPKQRYPA